jgi:dCTP deaminase
MGTVQGCSSIGRQGLFVQNAGLIDPGWSGQITLELYLVGDFAYHLRTGDRIAQISFQYLDEPCAKPYGMRGRYMHQRGATPARPPRG